MDFLSFFYVFMTALFTALIVVPFLRKWAFDQGTLDAPDERKEHDVPMPRLGGVAIFLSFLLSVLVYVPITDTVRGFLAGGLIIFVTGLVDDLTELTAKRKFAGQIAACLTASILGKLWLVNIGNLFGSGDIILPMWFAVPFTVFAMVGVINAINLVDGLDGLAGGISMIALTAYAVFGWIDHDQNTVFLTAALAGSLLGFLKYNFYPARIFMGDAGSLTVGFIIGYLSLHIIHQPTSTVSPLATVLVIGLPLFDTIWVMSRRMLHGESPFSADRTHVHHKFLNLGFEHRFTVVIIYVLSLFWACSALLLRSWPDYLLLAYLLGTALLFYSLLRFVLQNPDRFDFLQRDATAGIRSTVAFQKIAGFIDSIIPIILGLLGIYLAFAAWTIAHHNHVPWQVALILLVAGCYIWRNPLTENRQFLMMIGYMAVGLAAFEVWHADDIVLFGTSIKYFGDVILAVSGVIVIFKIMFRRAGEFFLSTADYLTLALCVFLSIVSQKSLLMVNMEGPLFRAVVAIMILRTLCSRSQPFYRNVAVIMAVFLVVVSVAGFVRS